jgi:O-acetyl-ADP-ribose deacetylase
MAQWSVHHGDIYTVDAEVLICSANVFLTLSGGVGGELFRRYGSPMQEPLNEHLARLGVRHITAGDVVAVPGAGTPYRLILHAVAVDGMYDSSPNLVRSVVDKCLRMSADVGANSAVMPALATGYGHLSVDQFAEGLIGLQQEAYPPVDSIVVALRDKADSLALTKRLDSVAR